MPGGTCPKNLEAEFISDVQAGLTNRQLAEKYRRNPRTVRAWKSKLRASGKLRDDPDEQPRHRVEYGQERPADLRRDAPGWTW
jgi:hypothetical protein